MFELLLLNFVPTGTPTNPVIVCAQKCPRACEQACLSAQQLQIGPNGNTTNNNPHCLPACVGLCAQVWGYFCGAKHACNASHCKHAACNCVRAHAHCSHFCNHIWVNLCNLLGFLSLFLKNNNTMLLKNRVEQWRVRQIWVKLCLWVQFPSAGRHLQKKMREKAHL